MNGTDLQASLSLWPNLQGGRATLINLSENHTFRIDLPRRKGREVPDLGDKVILRVHRPGYNNSEAIHSELAWMDALRSETGLRVPQPILGTNGQMVQRLKIGAQPERFGVLFAFEEGVEPQVVDDLGSMFGQLGGLAAICHAHAENWRVPQNFTRPRWDENTILNADGLWGDWRKAPGVSGDRRDTLDKLDKALRDALPKYGHDPSRFGIIHADMRLANLLVHENQTMLIDFDDCGFGWFGYDFAAAISFFEDDPKVPSLLRAWLQGYAQHRTLSEQDLAAIDALVMLRRMALLAWIGSHHETELAQSHANDFAEGTCVLAQTFLATGRLFTDPV